MADENPMDAIRFADIYEMSYEEALAELEEIVAALEGQGHTLEKALTLFERGQSLAKHCGWLIDQAELKIQKIAGDGLVDFEVEI